MTIPERETDRVEFKQKLNNDAAEVLAAFSNAKGGTVYVGVSDNGKVIGTTVGKETIPVFINEVKHKTTPSIIPDIEVLDIGGKTVLAVSVTEHPMKPVSFFGKYYKRVSASNHLLSTDEVANMYLKTINASWDMYPDPLHTLDDLSFDKIRKCMEAFRRNGMTVSESVPEFLAKNRMIRDDRPTFAAFLMFKSEDYVTTTIELGRFQDAITIKDTARTKADILTQVDEVINYVKKHINLEVIITGEPRNTQKWQYPMEAIREIVLNMIIHRDYRSSSDSIVKIFDNRIEFYNPGGLPEEITVDDLLSDNYRSIPRNKKIAEFFKDLGLIEKYGSGIKRIIGYFQEEGLPLPDFRNIAAGFMVTVFSANGGLDENVGLNGGLSGGLDENFGLNFGLSGGLDENFGLNFGLNESDIAVLEYFNKNPMATQKDVAVAIGKTSRTVESAVSVLKEKGMLIREGGKKHGKWVVVHKNFGEA